MNRMIDRKRASGSGVVLALASALGVLGCGGDEGSGTPWNPELGGTSDDATSTAGEEEGSEADSTVGETNDPACLPGEVLPCPCPDGLTLGEKLCDPDGLGFGPCECDAVDPDTGNDTGEPGGTTTGEPEGDVVCYPGMAYDYSTCLPLHSFDPMPPGYEYPAPYQGNDNYRAPVALIDLEEVDPSTWLAPNFQLVEIAQAAKGRYAVVQVHAIESIQALRDEVGAIGVNSGYRSPAYNAGLDGAATYSRHMYGDAFDMDPLAASLTTLENACVAEGGMLVEYTTHVHCDFRFDPVDEEFFGPPMAQDEVDRPLFSADLQHDADGVWRAPAEGFDEGEPQRRWAARDAAGSLLATGIGASFVPPPGAATVEVRVGAQVERSAVAF